MSGDIEYGSCDICKTQGPLSRKYYRYDVKCECCNAKDDDHLEIIRHCSECDPRPPRQISVMIAPQDAYEEPHETRYSEALHVLKDTGGDNYSPETLQYAREFVRLYEAINQENEKDFEQVMKEIEITNPISKLSDFLRGHYESDECPNLVTYEEAAEKYLISVSDSTEGKPSQKE